MSFFLICFDLCGFCLDIQGQEPQKLVELAEAKDKLQDEVTKCQAALAAKTKDADEVFLTRCCIKRYGNLCLKGIQQLAFLSLTPTLQAAKKAEAATKALNDKV